MSVKNKDKDVVTLSNRSGKSTWMRLPEKGTRHTQAAKAERQARRLVSEQINHANRFLDLLCFGVAASIHAVLEGIAKSMKLGPVANS